MSSFSIVVVNASVTTAAAPSHLQQTGAMISQGGTNTAPGTLTLTSGLSDVTAILAAGKAITSLTWASNVVTVTTTAPHGWTNGDVVPVVIAGAAPSGYNGTFQGTITGASTLTYPLTTNPGAATTTGTVTLGSGAQLTQMATTYYSGNGVPSVYVLELGEGTAVEGVAALSTFISAVSGTPQQIYAYLVPREWDNVSQYIALTKNFTATNAMTYFYTTTTLANQTAYAGIKSVYAQVEAPAIGATEFSAASPFGNALKQTPSSTAKLTPMCYSPSYGTTSYPLKGNASTFTSLTTNNVNWIGTGQEGGISTNILFRGMMSDGNDWNFWYATDWAQIQMAQAAANEVIIGAASAINPLYYNQPGINRLQNRVYQVATNGVTYGVLTGQLLKTKMPIATFQANVDAGAYAGMTVINAEPFTTYVNENPSDYGVGKYGGLTAAVIPQLGFKQIVINLNSTTIVSA